MLRLTGRKLWRQLDRKVWLFLEAVFFHTGVSSKLYIFLDVFVKAPPAFINDTSDYIINGKASVETFGSNDNRQTYLDQNKQLFENEIIHAQKNINHCFKVTLLIKHPTALINEI